MKRIEGEMVAGPTWGMALFQEPDGMHTLAFHHDPECRRPYAAYEIDRTILERVKGELEEVMRDRTADTPTINSLKRAY